MIQAAFHLGYLTSLFIVGFLADHFGAKRTYMLTGIAAWASPWPVRAFRRRLLVGVLAARCSPALCQRRHLHAGAGAHQRPRRARAARPRHGLSDRRVERRLRALPRALAGAGAHVHRLARRADRRRVPAGDVLVAWHLCLQADRQSRPSASRRRVIASRRIPAVWRNRRGMLSIWGYTLPQLGTARPVGLAAGVPDRCSVSARRRIG